MNGLCLDGGVDRGKRRRQIADISNAIESKRVAMEPCVSDSFVLIWDQSLQRKVESDIGRISDIDPPLPPTLTVDIVNRRKSETAIAVSVSSTASVTASTEVRNVATADKFEVSHCIDPNRDEWIASQPMIGDNRLTICDLKCNQSYHIRCRAGNRELDLWGDYSKPIQVSTQLRPPLPPTIAVTDIASQSATVEPIDR